MVITAGDMLLLIVKSSSCGNITSDGCIPLLTLTLSKQEGKFGIILMRLLDTTSLVKEVPY